MHFLNHNLFIALLFACFIATARIRKSGFLSAVLRIICNDKHLNFEELLNKDNSVSIHHERMHALAIEICKVPNGFSLEIMDEIFRRSYNEYNLRHAFLFFCISSSMFIMLLSLFRIWVQRLESEYLLKLQINPLMVLNKKAKNGNQLTALVEFAKYMCRT